MLRLRMLIRRLLRARTDSEPLPPVPPSSVDLERMAQVVIERLSEDETLRGQLTDAGFGPILTFVTSLVPVAARRAAEHSSAQTAEDQVSRSARALTRGIVAAVETGDAAALDGCLGAPMLSPDEATRVRQSVSLGLDADGVTGRPSGTRDRRIESRAPGAGCMKRGLAGWTAPIAVVLIAVVLVLGLVLVHRRTTQPAPTSPAGFSDWYQIYFTDPKYPDNPANHHGGIDTQLVDLMNKATKTIDVASYDFNLGDVATAMAQASRRGVRVRMVTDTDTLTSTDASVQAAFATLKQAKIPVVDDQREAIMHDKFTVVDGEWVSTGSWNYTDSDTYHLNNNMIVIHSADLAANYTNEFEKMFVEHDFGKAKNRTNPHPVLSIEGTSARTCFSPETSCAPLIVQAIDGARTSVDFMAFSFTYNDIGNAMLARARNGVAVSGVFETTGSETVYSQYKKLKDAGLAVYTDGNPWSMHHKVIIVDDRIVIFGSFNFSASANTSNDENLLIIDNADLAHAFTAEFQRVLAVARNPPAH